MVDDFRTLDESRLLLAGELVTKPPNAYPKEFREAIQTCALGLARQPRYFSDWIVAELDL